MSRIDTRHPEPEGNAPRRLPLWPLLALLTLGSAAAPAQAYTTIDCPGSSSSSARGINDRGDIVGSCDDDSGSHGFLLRHGTLTMIDFPGATLTTAFGLNNLGDVVGRYTDADDVVHGYVLRHGHFRTIDPPGMIPGPEGPPRTAAIGIDDLGRIVGFYDGSDGVHHGYLFDSGVFRNIDFPGAFATGAQGINDLKRIAGGYVEANGVQHGFLLGGESSRRSISRAPEAPEVRESTSSATSSEAGATIPNVPPALRTHSCSRRTGSRTSRFPAHSRPWPLASTTWARSWAPISVRMRSSTGT